MHDSSPEENFGRRTRSLPTALLYGAVLIVAFNMNTVSADDEGDEENQLRREQMRELVVALAEEARSVRPDFVVVTQNGLDLMVRDGDPEGPFWSDYTSVLNGVSQEGVSFGFDDYCDQTPSGFSPRNAGVSGPRPR